MCIRDSSLPIYNFCQACKKTFPVICIRKNELKPAIRKFWFETMYNHWGDDNGIIFMKCVLLVIKYEMKFSLCHSKYFSHLFVIVQIVIHCGFSESPFKKANASVY